MRHTVKLATAATLLLGALCLQGCLVTSAVGTAAGVTGAVVKGTAKGGVAVGRAVIPGDGKDDKDK